MALVCEEVHGIAREVRHHRGRCGCRAAAREWVFAGLAHGSATPELHERLHTRRTFDDEQVRLNEKAPISGGFAEPLPDQTGAPLLTTEPPGTAVRNAVSADRARPLGPKLSVLVA